MDRALDVRYRRIKLLKRGIVSLIGLAALLVVFGWAPHLVRPSVKRNELRTAVVDSGPVESTISASGAVVPEFEQVLASPLDARVVKILKKPGASLKRGEPILDLDVSESVLSLDKLNEKLALKENEQRQKKIELENTLIDRESRLNLKRVDVKSLEVQLVRQEKLRAQGLNSEVQYRQAQVDLEKARIELAQLEESIGNARRATDAQLRGLELEIGTLGKERTQARQNLDRATTKADRDGVLTWVVSEEGATVHKGEIVARIADLSTFRVQAALSDIHAGRLAVGLPARVKISETDYLDGAITNVLPTIKDGVMTVLVGLEDKSSKLLRANLRVDVFIVTDRKQQVLRIKRGAFGAGTGVHDLFVVRGDRAVKMPVRLGLFSFDYCEIEEGLLAGDEVILSDMKDYRDLKEIQLN